MTDISCMETDYFIKSDKAMTSVADIAELLGGKVNLPDIRGIVNWVLEDERNLENLYKLTESSDNRQSVNALWSLSQLPESKAAWLQSLQNDLIDKLLTETNTSRKRLLLQLLRRQSYDKTTLRTDFIDYCFSKINSEHEPYAVRCFSIYCAFKMCRFYPELVAELEEYLDLLSIQSLSPGLQSALRTTQKNIKRLSSGKLKSE